MHAKVTRNHSADTALVERLVRLGSMPWLNPNERCACVTLALALIVCPDQVSVAAAEFADAEDLQYRNVKVSLPADVDPLKGGFEFFSRAAAWPPLRNLGARYEDSENDLEARELLGYWPLCDNDRARAALLTLAWICLVEGCRAVRKSVNGAFVIAAPRYGVELTLDGFQPQRVVGVRYAPPAQPPRRDVAARAR